MAGLGTLDNGSEHGHGEGEPLYLYRSKLPDIEISSHLCLHDYCFEKLGEFAERPCIVQGSNGKVYSYGEVDLISRRVGSGLAKLGIGHGEVVMLLLPNCPEFAFIFLGSSRIGAIATAANPFYTPGEIAKQAMASGARVIITQACYVEKLCDLNRGNGSVLVITIDTGAPEGCLHFSVLAEADENEIPLVEIRPHDLVSLPFSSGTTGLPKGVMLTHRALISSVAQHVDGENPNLYLHSEDVVLCVPPLFHIYGNTLLLGSIRVGAASLIMQRFEIRQMLELIQKFKVTVAPFVPPIVLAIARNPIVEKYDISSIRMVMSGAAPLGKELADAFRARIPNATVAEGYGMTEAGPVALSLGLAKVPFTVKPGSSGTVVRNAEVKIVEPETGVSLSYNQAGEICIRGPQIMKGYLNDLEATEMTIDKDGWLRTGDVGYIDDDEELFLVDRVKELIKYKGFQVPPAELEAILVSHPSIADAAVVSQKDEIAGEVPVAFVVSSGDGPDLTVKEIKEFVAKQVVFYKKLHNVYFIEAIPKSPSGKILRKDLRAKLMPLAAAIQ